MRTVALGHIPSKEIQTRNPPQEIMEPVSHPDSLGLPSMTSGIEEGSSSQATSNESLLDLSESLTTNADNFGVYRVYARKPLHALPQCGNLNTSSDFRLDTAPNQGPPHLDMQTLPYYHPFSNPSAAAMLAIHHLGASSTRSINHTNGMANILVGLDTELSISDLSKFSAAVEHRKLDDYLSSTPDSRFQHEDGWIESSVRIRLPLDKKKMPETDAAEFEIGGVFHRDIINIISSVYQSDVVKSFNHIPYKEFWKPSEDAPPERLYGEIFSSQTMLEADDDICKCCLENDLDHSDLEAVSVPILLYSDSTHLASFGTASCWPVYMFFGSQSKYVRAMPTSSACHHLAYMPKVHHI